MNAATRNTLNKTKKILLAVLLDIGVWFYIFLCAYKVGYQDLILDLRENTFNWMQPVYCLLAALIPAILGFFLPRASLGRAAFKMYHPYDAAKKPFRFYFWLGMFLIVLTFAVGVKVTQLSLTEFFSDSGLQGARRIFVELVTPNWEIFNDALFASIETIYMAFIATVLALPVAFVVSFFAARNLMRNSRIGLFIYAIVRFITNVTRSIEPIVWAIIFSVWVGIGPFAGMLALWLHSIAGLVKLYSEQIEGINHGPLEAMAATGARPMQIVWFGVVPQIVLPFLSFSIYRWDINVRMATVIGLVGGGGIGTLLMQYQGISKWHEVGLLVIFIAGIVWIMDYASARLREAIA